MSKQLVITGCGRSGTKWIRNVLNILKIDAHHEKAYRGHNGTIELHPDFRHQIEASWLAAPSIAQLDRERFVICQQIRNPIDVINSIHYIFKDPTNIYGNFAKSNMTLSGLEHPAEVAAEYWIQWNQSILTASPDYLWTLEELKTEKGLSKIQAALLECNILRAVPQIQLAIDECQDRHKALHRKSTFELTDFNEDLQKRIETLHSEIQSKL